MADADVKKIIQDMAKSWGEDEEGAGAAIAMLKGLAFSKDPLAKKFIKELDKATTKIADDLMKANEAMWPELAKKGEKKVVKESIVEQANRALMG